MPREEFEVRYHRHGKFAGRAVKLIRSVPNSGGIWTCVTPSYTPTTIKIGARSAVTTRRIPGVTYQGAPTLYSAAKRRARDRSNEIVQQPVVAAELDAHRPSTG